MANVAFEAERIAKISDRNFTKDRTLIAHEVRTSSAKNSDENFRKVSQSIDNTIKT
jgi:hypothetical protein